MRIPIGSLHFCPSRAVLLMCTSEQSARIAGPITEARVARCSCGEVNMSPVLVH